MNRLTRAARALLAWRKVFQAPRDAWRYARLRSLQRRGLDGPPVLLRLRTLGGAAVLCRPGQDVWTLKHTFIEGFHRPPRPLPAGATIVDLGSNVGYTVADLACRHPDAQVIGVEMDERNFDLAVRNTAVFGSRVRLLRAAVWTEDGEIAYTGVDADAFHVDPAAGGTAMTAPAVRLDTLLRDHGVERVHYLKMDIEGAEAAILAAPLDWADRVDAMKIELHPPADSAACRAALEARGFACTGDARHPNTIIAMRAPSRSPAGRA